VGVAVALTLALLAVGASALTDRPHKYFRQAVLVNAPRHVVWDVLTDFESYPDWNPYVTSARGTLREGATLHLRREPPGDGSKTADAEILIVRENRKLEWQVRKLVAGVLDEEQIFRTKRIAPTMTNLVEETRLEGLLAPVTGTDDARRGLRLMILALAREAERRYQSSSE